MTYEALRDPTADVLSGTDSDGSRYVWFFFRRNGYPYDYRPAASFAGSGVFALAVKNAPQLGDVAWWNDFVGIYDPHISPYDVDSPYKLDLRTAYGERSYKQMEKEFGRPVLWLRHKDAVFLKGKKPGKSWLRNLLGL